MQKVLREASVADELRAFILETFLAGESETTLLDDDLLIEGGIVDSGSVMELVAFLEERYRLRVADDDLVLENFATIGALASFVETRLNRSCGSS